MIDLELKVKALSDKIELKDFGKILYQFNQLRGYSGGNNDEDSKKKKEDTEENKDNAKKKYEVIVQKVEIKNVEESKDTFTGGKDKDEKYNYFDVTILFDGEEKEGRTKLQNLKEKEGQEEELEIRIRRNKEGKETSLEFALPKKSNWRKAMENSEKTLQEENLIISQLRLRDLKQNKWTKIRNRVFLRKRYKEEFDKIWDTQAKEYDVLNNCLKETLEKIINYIFPGTSESQQQLRKTALEKGLKYIIKEQVIYYQRPLKPQTELISNCKFEKEEKVIATSHPLFQEFRCWKQINNLYIGTKMLDGEKYKYQNRYLTAKEKQNIYDRLQTQKEVSFGAVIEILNQGKNNRQLNKEQKDYFLNGLNVKAKLKGCDTLLSIKKILGECFDKFLEQDSDIVEKIWTVIFDVKNHDGSEYEIDSKRVSSIIELLQKYTDKETAAELALKFAQNIKFPRKYASLSKKAIEKILPLMQPNPQNVSEEIKNKFENIKTNVEKVTKNEAVDIETGEIINDLEDYVIDFVKSNPDILKEGGLMEYLAISLVYGKHTTAIIKAQIKNYHDIKYEERNLRNPIVEQLANETMQVIKAIWKQYKFNSEELEIRVELARDLKNSADERDKIYKGQLKSKKINDKAKERLQEEGIAITDENILKFRLYEQQKCMSPYTKKKCIPFSKLFNDKEYDIDHIIPKSRYYDDSFSNKVICEKFINKEKSNRTSWEYISQQNSKDEIMSVDEFIKHVNDNFFGKKKKNLLTEKIPTNPVERQLKDTQYISVAVKNELAKIVGSENVKTSTGEVTDFLRSRWGLKKLFMELTESRFKQMELWDLDENGNPKTEWIQKYFDKEKQKHVYEIKNWSKRYDYRHHAIDALVVALTTQSHIQRLNNLNKYYQEELTKRKDEFKIEIKEGENILEAFFNLEAKRRDEILKNIESFRKFEKPIFDLVKQVREHLETMIISIKPKDKLGIKIDDKTNKKQLKIRGALHQETYYGKLDGKDTKTLEIGKLSAKDIDKIVDGVLQEEIKNHKEQNYKDKTMKEAFTGEGLKAFNESRFQRKQPTKLKPPVYKVKVWYNSKETAESSLQRLYDSNEKQNVITGDNYLFLVMEKAGKRVFDVASLYNSVSIANDAIKDNITDFKRKIAEGYRIKHKEKPERVLFTLLQNELVYLPTSKDDEVLRKSESEFKEWINILENKKAFSKRIYKVVKFGDTTCHFLPNTYASYISVAKDLSKEELDLLKIENEGKKKIPKKDLNFVEFSSYRDCSPYEVGEVFVKSILDKKSKIKPLKIQDTCIKIQVDWLGNISLIKRNNP